MREAVRVPGDYAKQLERAVEAGIAFKGDALGARTQFERNQLTLRQAQEQRRLAAARLAQTLHLDPAVELLSKEDELLPMSLVTPNGTLDSMVARALGARPELRQSAAIVDATKKTKDGVVYGPLVPTVGAQAFVGGLACALTTRSRLANSTKRSTCSCVPPVGCE